MFSLFLPFAPVAHAQDAAWQVTYNWTDHAAWYYTPDSGTGIDDSYEGTYFDTEGGVGAGPYNPTWLGSVDIGSIDMGGSRAATFLGASDTDTVTATLEWVDADGNPAPNPPKCVIVKECGTAQYVGINADDSLIDSGADNGLGDTEEDYDGYAWGYQGISGVYPLGSPQAGYARLHYAVYDGSSGTITLPERTLSSYIDCSRDGTSPDGSDTYAANIYLVSAYPITLDISGGLYASGIAHFMIGQGVTATLNKGALPDFPTDTYNWTVDGGNPFDGYVAYDSFAEYHPLFSFRFGNEPSMFCYFAKPDTATFTCLANLAGQSVTLTRQVALEKPSAELSVNIGTVNLLGSASNPAGIQLQTVPSAFVSHEAAGITWSGTITTPSGFDITDEAGLDEGMWNWTQLVAVSNQIQQNGVWKKSAMDTQSPPLNIYGIYGADGSYPYSDLWYVSDGTPSGNADSPWQEFTDDTSITDINVHESFNDYLMYLPPGGDSIVVPLKKINWYWQGNASQTTGLWSVSGQDAEWSFDSDFPDFPKWNFAVNAGDIVYVP